MAVLLDMARWARAQTPAGLPPDVLRRARLQHLSTAAAVRTGDATALVQAFGQPGSGVALPTGHLLPARAAAAALAGLSGAREYDDFLLGCHPNHGAVAATWTQAADHDLDALCTATVAAVEVAGRVGLAHLFSPVACQQATYSTALTTAVSVGLLRGLSEEQLAHAMAIALGPASHVPFETLLGGNQARGEAIGEAALLGWDAVEAALRGDAGNLDLLDGDGLVGLPLFAHMPAAYAGLGQRWLTRSLSYKLCPADPWTLTAFQSYEELLRRHMKAASKRLRTDQLHGVEIRVDLPTWVRHQLATQSSRVDSGTLPYRLDYAVAAMLTAYEGGPVLTDDAWLTDNAEVISELATKVQINHEWHGTMTLAETFTHRLGPLASHIKLREWPELGRTVREHFSDQDPGITASDILGILAGRPDRIHAALRDSVGMDLSDIDFDAYHLARPVEVKMYTIRGGWWPERRDVVEGGPEYPMDFLASDVVSKFARATRYTGPDNPGQGDEAKPIGERFLDLDGATSGVDAIGVLAE